MEGRLHDQTIQQLNEKGVSNNGYQHRHFSTLLRTLRKGFLKDELLIVIFGVN